MVHARGPQPVSFEPNCTVYTQIWGALSDSAVSKKTGRYYRRPLIVVGQIFFCGACTVMATATTYPVFLLSCKSTRKSNALRHFMVVRAESGLCRHAVHDDCHDERRPL